MSRKWWEWWTRRGDALTPVGDPGVSFSWPRDTDLTREQIEIAMRDAVAAPSTQPDAGTLPVETTASDAPRPPTIQTGGKVSISTETDTGVAMTAADWIERALPGNTPVLGGIVGTRDADGSTVVWSDGPAMYGHAETPGAAMRDYAECMVDVRVIQRRYGDAFDRKPAIRRQLAACRGDCGDGPCGCDYEEWSR